MKKYKNETVQNVSSYICDKCGREANSDKDPIEAQEFISIEKTGYYGSIFGDGTLISLDLCQHCFKEILGKWVRLKNQ